MPDARSAMKPPYTNGLPDDHPLRPLEDRLLELDADAGPMNMWTGNCIAALRVFAAEYFGAAAAVDSPDWRPPVLQTRHSLSKPKQKP